MPNPHRTLLLLAALLLATASASAQQNSRTAIGRPPALNNTLSATPVQQASSATRRFGPLVADLAAVSPQIRYNGRPPQTPRNLQPGRVFDRGPEQQLQLLSGNGVQPAGPTSGVVTVGKPFANELMTVTVRADTVDWVSGSSVSVPLYSETANSATLELTVNFNANAGGVLLDCTVIGLTDQTARARVWKPTIENNQFTYYLAGESSVVLGRDFPLPVLIKKPLGYADAARVLLSYTGGAINAAFNGCTVTPLA